MVKMKPPKVRQPKSSKELEAEAPAGKALPDPPKENDPLTALQRAMGKWPPNNFGS